MDNETIYIILIILLIYQASPQIFRRKWMHGEPIITHAQIALNNEMDFLQISSFNLTVFKEKIVKPIKFILSKPKYQIEQWLCDKDVHWQLPVNGRKPKLSVEDRTLRAIMLSKNNKTKLLEILWGQKNSTIYEDAWLIMRVLLKLKGYYFKLPLKGSDQYKARVGLGVLGEAFDTGVYIMDGHKVRIVKPRMSQRDYYNGHKKFHCLSYLFVHDGTGKAVYIHGGERGATTDVILLRGSSFGRKINQYVDVGDWVLCDGAWRHEGSPYLCRFTDRTYLTAAEMAFNFVIADKRVICENYYGRLHTLFPILNLWRLRLDKLDVWVRSLSILTNIHIENIAPLR